MNPAQCHELSTQGMSVFLDALPTFEHFVVDLGDGDCGPLMLCQIIGERAVYMYGRSGYIVDAQFVRRGVERSVIEPASC
jgi:hypothetical protein